MKWNVGLLRVNDRTFENVPISPSLLIFQTLKIGDRRQNH